MGLCNYFTAEVQDEDDSYDEDDHNDVIQYLLDVVDEEAQNLLNRSNAVSGNHLPGTVITRKSEAWAREAPFKNLAESIEELVQFCRF